MAASTGISFFIPFIPFIPVQSFFELTGMKGIRQDISGAPSFKNVVSILSSNGKWGFTNNHRDRNSAFDPMLCDRLNQISLNDATPVGEAVRLIPSNAIVKGFVETENFIILACAMNPEPVTYKIKLFLIEKLGPHEKFPLVHKVQLVDELEVTDEGYFCGAQLISTKDCLLLFHEPAASSNYLSVLVVSVPQR